MDTAGRTSKWVPMIACIIFAISDCTPEDTRSAPPNADSAQQDPPAANRLAPLDSETLNTATPPDAYPPEPDIDLRPKGPPSVPDQVSFPDPLPLFPFPEVCQGLNNTQDCAEAIEAKQVGAANGSVALTASGVCFAVPRVTWHCIAHDTALATGARYQYLGTLQRAPYHVLRTQWYEGGEVMLVHRETGRKIPIDGMPVLSPDNKHLAVASGDIEARYNWNRFRVWRLSGDSLELSFSVAPEDWAPGDATWLDERTVEISRTEWSTDLIDFFVADTLVLHRSDEGWMWRDR